MCIRDSINILPLTDGKFEGTALRDASGTPSASLGVRPEYMTLHTTDPLSGNAILARLEDLTYLGSETRLALRTPGGVPLILQMPTVTLPDGLAPGANLWTTWPAGRGLYL